MTLKQQDWRDWLGEAWRSPQKRPLLPQIRFLWPAVLTALFVIVLVHLGSFQPLENLAYNLLFQMRGAVTWDERVVVVAIDERSLAELGRFPWNRQRYADLLGILTKAQPSIVAFDLLFPESSPEDGEFAAAMTQNGRVVLPNAWDATGNPIMPTAVLRDAVLLGGHIYQRQDGDGVARSIVPQIDKIPAFSLAIAQGYSLVREPVVLPSSDRPLWLNWRGPIARSKTYSFVDVIQSKVNPEIFEDKIILVGTTAAGFDPLRTPFDHNPPTSNIYLHATALDNLLRQNSLQVMPLPWETLGLLLMAIGLGLTALKWNFRRQVLLAVVLCGAWLLLGLMLLRANYWIPIASPILLIIATTTALTVWQRLQEEALFQQEVQRLWQTYHRDLVSQTINPTMPLQPPTSERFPLQSTLALRMTQLATLAEQFGRSQSTQAAIARSLSIGLLAADLEGLVWFCNPIATECLGVRVGDRLQTRLMPDWYSAEEWQTQVHQLLQQSPVIPHEVQRGDRWFELRLEPLMAQSENERWILEDRVEPIRLAGGLTPIPQSSPDLAGFLLLLEDVTARKQVEENLTQQMEELERIGQLKDDFLSSVSHDLRAPMANMRMAIQMLQVAESDEQRNRYVHILESECQRETHLINDLLNLQQLEAGAKPVNLESIQLETWLLDLLAPFHQRTQSRNQSLGLKLPDDPPILISDRSSLERILVELLNNACKYTPPQGAIHLTVRSNPKQTVFMVNNTGSEIPPTELSKIFDKFYRVPTGDRWHQGGTGLGLALVKKLAEQLGGTIQLTSQSGQTTFTVEIPTVLEAPMDDS
ncbi:MAG: CHASE2 domain-containing protein [Oculatellaceae cyanobacterium Prado106]|jgi:signal transduction histidine kinase/CHASE2 domain-containing sensor protein|nr:CHASE2 domain-containing protein [Oculatellaceae cyanobacterium Prado106]